MLIMQFSEGSLAFRCLCYTNLLDSPANCRNGSQSERNHLALSLARRVFRDRGGGPCAVRILGWADRVHEWGNAVALHDRVKGALDFGRATNRKRLPSIYG